MKTWVRLHTALPNNRKVQSLPPILFKFWINCLAFAGREEDGTLPPFADMAWELHESESRIARWIGELVKARLIEVEDGGADHITFYRPHNWRNRQFDVSPATERTRRFRERSRSVPETFPERSRSVPETFPERSLERSSRASVLFCSDSVMSSSENKTFLTEKSIFPEWWQMWSKVRGTHHSREALQAWLSVVPMSLEGDVLECTASYLESLDNNAKGYNPHTFIFEQAKEKFMARWPAFARNGVAKETRAQRLARISDEREGITE